MSISPTAAQLAEARRLLAVEDAAGKQASGTSASRVHAEILRRLTPLIGEVGVQALFVRAAKLAASEFAFLAHVPLAERDEQLRVHLESLESQASVETAQAPTLGATQRGDLENFFACFLALLTELIGERLTHQVLRSASSSPGQPKQTTSQKRTP